MHANGAALSDLLQHLIEAWPVPIRDLTLVGHCLVSVAATQHAREHGTPWAGLPATLITLGTPHHGAPLARLLREVNQALARVPVIGPVVDWAAVRSDGGSDLCPDPHTTTADQPAAAPPDKLPVTVISASRHDTTRNPFAALIGDGLVPVYSADAHGATIWDVTHHHVDGAGHMALLNHPDAYQHIGASIGKA